MQIIHWRPLNEREHSTRTAAAAAWSGSLPGVRSRGGRLPGAAAVGVQILKTTLITVIIKIFLIGEKKYLF